TASFIRSLLGRRCLCLSSERTDRLSPTKAAACHHAARIRLTSSRSLRDPPSRGAGLWARAPGRARGVRSSEPKAVLAAPSWSPVAHGASTRYPGPAPLRPQNHQGDQQGSPTPMGREARRGGSRGELGVSSPPSHKPELGTAGVVVGLISSML